MNSDPGQSDREVLPPDPSPYRPPPPIDDAAQPVELSPEPIRVAVASGLFALVGAALTKFLLFEGTQFEYGALRAVTVPAVLLGLFALACGFYFARGRTAAAIPLVKASMAVAAAPASLVISLPIWLAFAAPWGGTASLEEANMFAIAYCFAYFVSAFLIASVFHHRIAALPTGSSRAGKSA